jgi:hypothetical protein
MIGARPPRDGSSLEEACRPSVIMTSEDIEDVVRALTRVVDNLETCAARQSMRESFMQVRAYASATRHQPR